MSIPNTGSFTEYEIQEYGPEDVTDPGFDPAEYYNNLADDYASDMDAAEKED